MLFESGSICESVLQRSIIRACWENRCKVVRLAISGDTGLVISGFCASCETRSLLSSLLRLGIDVKFTGDQPMVLTA
ncbi:hypothetical protein ASC96_10425 [Rhizobium sp. Root1204]|nr:hypothetical protein ASC96_10425 [Rhizobium sp. Root1204]